MVGDPLGATLANVQIIKTNPGILQVRMANPSHSIISPNKLGHETHLNNPPTGILYPVSPGFLKLIRIPSDCQLMIIPVKKNEGPHNKPWITEPAYFIMGKIAEIITE